MGSGRSGWVREGGSEGWVVGGFRKEVKRELGSGWVRVILVGGRIGARDD